MDDEAADEEDRHERHVEERRRAHAGEEAADLVEIADRLQALGRLGALERHASPRGRRRGETSISSNRAPMRASILARMRVEPALKDVGGKDDQRDADQGRDAAARQHAVVDLQHVDRAGEHQKIDDAREDRDANERRRAGLQRLRTSELSCLRLLAACFIFLILSPRPRCWQCNHSPLSGTLSWSPQTCRRPPRATRLQDCRLSAPNTRRLK